MRPARAPGQRYTRETLGGRGAKMASIPNLNRLQAQPKWERAVRRIEGEMVQATRYNRRPIFPAVIVLVLLVVAVFSPVPGFEFIDFDVDEQVLENPHIRGLTGQNLMHILTTPCINSYYPLRTLTFAIDYQIWGLEPRGFKLANVLIHLTNVILVFWLVLRLIRNGRLSSGSSEAWDVSVATVSAGIFAVHPVVVEPVTWVAGREELLMTLGALGCFHLHFTARRLEETAHRSRKALVCQVGATAACAAACLSNAVAAVIPLLITTWDILMLRRPKLRRIIRGTSALWVIGLVTFVIKKAGRIPESDPVPQMSSIEWQLFVPKMAWLNLKALVWPTDLCLLGGWPRPQGLFELEVILGMMTVGLACLVLLTLRRRKRILFGLLWCVLALVPSSHIFFIHHVSRADRFLYLPLVGLALALGAGLQPVRSVLRGHARWAMTGTGVLLVLLLAARSADQIQTWRNSFSVYTHALSLCESSIAHNNLGNLFFKQGQLTEAIRHFRQGLSIKPHSAQTHYNLGTALAAQGQLPEGILHLRRALMINPDYADAHYNLGTVLGRLGQFPGAIHHFRQAIRIEPRLWEAHLSLGALFLDQDKRQSAVKHLREALKLQQDSVKAQELLRHALEE